MFRSEYKQKRDALDIKSNFFSDKSVARSRADEPQTESQKSAGSSHKRIRVLPELHDK
ncbi:hypothetical protein [Leptospira gomenensis]|uniref:hypothetical protein n=1 Tax=Leptospira gomenensis TaxID=2484974 RepID=UPI001438381F|nr:hypothetical protein [Leptospira gomenensis]